MGWMMGSMAARELEYVRVRDVVPATRNPKEHDLPRLVDLIRRFGFVESVVRDGRTGRLVAGHGRLEALEVMERRDQSPPDGITVDQDGAWLVPVTVGWASRSDDDAEALGVALNAVPALGGWNSATLAETLRDINAVDPDLRRLIGYEDAELDDLLAGLQEDGGGWDDDPAEQAAPRTGGADPTDRNQRRSTSLAELADGYDDQASRIMVLSWEGPRYVWAVQQLRELGEQRGLDSNADVVLALIADAVGQAPPDA
ncbi:hypothetical protein FRAAL2748 [Frankia alni ACN14a]|uniref:ParB/Sulfiredoxin domain-containing protein n=2 Tax=Frankiaceae TaxID=74712 RepID=Q0RM60_FRAAA|nr:hypothetical protein FRAAL2748 [Frankia alni ACN14a]